MILIFIGILCVVQLVLYLLKGKFLPKIPDFIILDLLILLNLFVFPKIFTSILLPDDLVCGLPVMGITFGFWIFSNLAVIVVHFSRKGIMALVRTKPQQRV
ncbi:hypothetical protein AB9K26_00245 [Psychroserpens sp. XS_ASV72]|uniref:hypothetical protein n=1 Tax=Psychroserpens sp. XS_ASV72 TaxID=3241293 RepID=UPI0035148822